MIYQDYTQSLDQEALKSLLAEGKLVLKQLVSKRANGPKEMFDFTIDHQEGLFINNKYVMHQCKESHNARSFSAPKMGEKAGLISLTYEGQTKEFPSRVKVRFFDTNTQTVVIGPLEVAIMNNFPVNKHSLRKIFSEESFRVLSD